ncbi:unnamed protein product [Adineta ricciae]|uniref:Aldehyde dehydrogenase domain-containing protein n=1 Tax=Adineta ricciae TaxID=249248 RepID=A0A815RN21_ADIRI|nr:unnamed protein product [Adineta ricciae]
MLVLKLGPTLTCGGSSSYDYAIATHDKINKMVFTGSVEIGKKIPKIAGKTNLKSISEVQLQRILSYIQAGMKSGAKFERGGERAGDKGHFIQSMIFPDVKDDMKVARKEICLILSPL